MSMKPFCDLLPQHLAGTCCLLDSVAQKGISLTSDNNEKGNAFAFYLLMACIMSFNLQFYLCLVKIVKPHTHTHTFYALRN